MKFKSITFVFSLILLSDLIIIGTELPHYFRYFSKPAITIVLLVYLGNIFKHGKWSWLLLSAALLFSLSGDIFLLLPNEPSWYFIGGLLSFLFAHIMYIFAFFKIENFKTSRSFLAILFLLFYALLVFKLIGEGLGELSPYVLLYMIVLLLMVLTVFVRNTSVTAKSYSLVLTGALLFMISDSLLAINKFYQVFAFADILIMLTYGYAQFLIIYGAVYRHRAEEKLKR